MIVISWKDKVSNDKVRAQPQLEKTDLIIKDSRLTLTEMARSVGHVLRMDDNRLPRQVVHWNISRTKKKPGKPKKELERHHTILESIGMTWEVAQQLAVNRQDWHQHVAQLSKVRSTFLVSDRKSTGQILKHFLKFFLNLA